MLNAQGSHHVYFDVQCLMSMDAVILNTIFIDLSIENIIT